MNVGLGPSDDLLKKKLSELDVRVEEQTNNVLITLRLWIKSFIFKAKRDQKVCLNLEKKDQLHVIALMKGR